MTIASLGLPAVLMPSPVGVAIALLAADGWMAGIVLQSALFCVQNSFTNFAVNLLSLPSFSST